MVMTVTTGKGVTNEIMGRGATIEIMGQSLLTTVHGLTTMTTNKAEDGLLATILADGGRKLYVERVLAGTHA